MNGSSKNKFSRDFLQENSFQLENIEESIIEVQRNILTSDNRYYALMTLDGIIPLLNDDLFVSNSSFWFQNLIKIIQENRNQTENVLCFKILNLLLGRIHEINMPILIKDTCMVPILIRYLIDFLFPNLPYSAHTLSICATVFPTIISTNRNLIENKIIETSQKVSQTENDVILLKLLGFCYTKTFLVHSSLMNKWRELISKLINTLRVFSKLPEFSSIEKPDRHFSFDDCVIKNFFQDLYEQFSVNTCKKLFFLCTALSTLITGQYSTKLPLPVEAILECMISLTLVAISKPTRNHKGISTQKSSIILENVFAVLRSLLTSCKSNILIYSHLLRIHILNPILDWLNESNDWKSLHIIEIRSSFYKFLSIYFLTLRMNSCLLQNDFKLILKMILNDIEVYDSNIDVSANNNQSDSKSINKVKTTTLSRDVNFCAINCLNSILNHCGNSLEKGSYIKIHSAVITTLLHIYRNWMDIEVPYKCEESRKELLETLRMFLINSPYSIDVPIECISALLDQADRLETSQSTREIVSTLKHLIDFVLLSRIPMKNEKLISKESSPLPLNGEKSSETIVVRTNEITTNQIVDITCKRKVPDGLTTTIDKVKSCKCSSEITEPSREELLKVFDEKPEVSEPSFELISGNTNDKKIIFISPQPPNSPSKAESPVLISTNTIESSPKNQEVEEILKFFVNE